MIFKAYIPRDVLAIGTKIKVSFLAKYNEERIVVSFKGQITEVQVRINTETNDVGFYYEVQESLNNDYVWVDANQVEVIGNEVCVGGDTD